MATRVSAYSNSQPPAPDARRCVLTTMRDGYSVADSAVLKKALHEQQLEQHRISALPHWWKRMVAFVKSRVQFHVTVRALMRQKLLTESRMQDQRPHYRLTTRGQKAAMAAG